MVGLVTTSLLLTFEAVKANIRIMRWWATLTRLATDPRCELTPTDYGVEELDANAPNCSAEPLLWDDPPGDMASRRN